MDLFTEHFPTVKGKRDVHYNNHREKFIFQFHGTVPSGLAPPLDVLKDGIDGDGVGWRLRGPDPRWFGRVSGGGTLGCVIPPILYYIWVASISSGHL